MMRQSGVRLVDTVRRVGRPKVTEKDEERGARVARLRIARGFDSQAKLVADVAERVAKKELAEENGLDRVEYQRVENGENRLTSEAIQDKLAAAFGVRSLPTVMLIRNGRPVDGFMGALPEGQIKEFLDKHLPAAEALQAQAATEEAQEPEQAGDAPSARQLAATAGRSPAVIPPPARRHPATV